MIGSGKRRLTVAQGIYESGRLVDNILSGDKSITATFVLCSMQSKYTYISRRLLT